MTTSWRCFVLASQDVRWHLAVPAFSFEQFQHLHELAEHENFLALGEQRFEQFEQRFGFAGSGVVSHELRVAANLAQPGERRQDVHFAFAQAVLADGLHDLLAAAAQFSQIKFALLFAERAIAPLLDAIRQVFGDLLFQAPKHERTQLGGEAAAARFFAQFGILTLRLVSLVKVGLRAEVAGLHEINDAPKIEQPVFERRAGERESLSRPSIVSPTA